VGYPHLPPIAISEALAEMERAYCSQAALALPVQHIAQREAGFQPDHAGQAREFVLVQAVIVVDSGYASHQNVVVLAGQEVAAHNVMAVAHGRLERAKHSADWRSRVTRM